MDDHIDPTRERFGAFRALPDDGPVHMLNLVRLRDRATYPDGREASGAEAYRSYGLESGPIFRRVGGRIAWTGLSQSTCTTPSMTSRTKTSASSSMAAKVPLRRT